MREKEFFSLIKFVLLDITRNIEGQIEKELNNLNDNSYKQRHALIDIKHYVQDISKNIQEYKLKQMYLNFSKKKAYKQIERIREKSESKIDKIKKINGIY